MRHTTTEMRHKMRHTKWHSMKHNMNLDKVYKKLGLSETN